MRRRMRVALALFWTVALVGAGPGAAADAAQTVALSARFSPERLGAPAAMTIAFEVRATDGGVPAPLTMVEVRFPGNLGLATSGLGVATCAAATLEEGGPAACPTNSIMGSGSALARFEVASQLFSETAKLGLVAGPSQDGNVRLLVSATGISPVAARIVMSSLLLANGLQLTVPLVPSVPEGPPVAVVAARATLGGNLTYVENARGRTIHYHPRGIGLPKRCPKGGFPFSATFSFLDGTTAAARTTVRCPRHD